MKILQSLFILCFCISITSCSPDDSNVFSLPQFTANVDGVDFSSIEASATIAAGGLGITAEDSNGDVILLSVRDFDGSQSVYDLGISNAIGAGTYSENGGDNSFISLLDSGSGSLTITDYNEANSLISGEFEFVGIRESFNDDMTEVILESVTITSGEFTNVIVGGLVDTDNNNIFSAIIDGEIFSPNSAQASSITLNGQTSTTLTALDSATGQSLSLNFGGEILVGTFDLETLPASDNYSATYNPDINSGTTTNGPVSGSRSTVTINSYDETNGTLQGTFQFMAGDITGQSDITFEITEGIFSVDIL